MKDKDYQPFGLNNNPLLVKRVKYLTERIDTLFDAIKHGDQEHQDWLRKAIDAHFAGRPVDRPSGKGSQERIAELEGAINSAGYLLDNGARGLAIEKLRNVLQNQSQDPEPEEKCPKCNGDCGGADLMCPRYGCCCEWIEGRWMRSIDCPIHGN